MIFEKEEVAVSCYTYSFVRNFIASDLMWQSGLALLLLVSVCVHAHAHIHVLMTFTVWYDTIETKLYVLRNCTLLNGTVHQWPVVKFPT